MSQKTSELKPLIDCQEHLPALAELWYKEISRQWVPGASIERAQRQLVEHLNHDKLPLGYVALQDKQAIGMAFLRENDGVRPDLTPWLGSLIVHPQYRRQKLGETLIEQIKTEARDRGYEVLYLLAFDPTIPQWYASLGWQGIGEDRLFGHRIALMKINL